MKSPIKRNILFVTTANLAMKPRLVKELKEARLIFNEVSVIAFKINNQTDEIHTKLCEELGIKHKELIATRDNFIPWLLVSIIHKVCVYIWPVFKKSLLVSAFASNKRTIQLILYFLYSKKKNINLVNGRNTATLFPLWLLHKYYNISVIFDVEDYHPGENVSWTNPFHERVRREFLIQHILPKAEFASCAGLPIMNQVKSLLKNESFKTMNINNTFPSKEFKFISPQKGKIQFVWFSVDISRKRGLELFIPVMYNFKDLIHLTLIGNKTEEFYSNFLDKYGDFITIKPTMMPNKLHHDICHYDVGLAIEQNDIDLNKDLAISNKIYAYVLAGLYIITTATTGQQYFMRENKFSGTSCSQNITSIRKTVQYVVDHIDDIRGQKKERFLKAKNLGWESESYKLVDAWNNINPLNVMAHNQVRV